MAAKPHILRMAFFVYILLNLSGLVLAENVPVYVMGLKSSSNYPSISAFESLSREEFRAKFLDRLVKDHESVVAFVQDQLSSEDLTNHRSLTADEKTFPHLESNLKHGPSLILPSVRDPVEGLRSMKSRMNVREVQPQEKFAANSLKPGLLIYHLPSTLKSNNLKAALRRNDEIIYNVMKELKSSNKDFVSLYTGLNPSHDSKAEMEVHYRIARQLQETDEMAVSLGEFVQNGNFLNSSDLIMYATGVTLELKSGYQNISYVGNLTWPPDSVTLEDVTNKSAIVKFVYNSNTEVKNVELKINFSSDSPSSFWGAQNILFNVKFATESPLNDMTFSLTPPYVFGASKGFSFSCNVASLTTSFKNDTAKLDLYVNFAFQRFQAEWQPKSTKSFSESFDCFTFFTIPIWMGTLTVLLFTIILSIGIFMLFEVKTMDRFDDPKGKSISVPVAD